MVSWDIYLGMIIAGFFVGVGNITGQWFFNKYVKNKLEKRHLAKNKIKTKIRNLLNKIGG